MTNQEPSDLLGSLSARAESEAPPVPRMPPRLPTGAGPAAAPAKREGGDVRRLIVGREISLSGNISACDELIVEGNVEANLTGSNDLRISETGFFKGSATVEEADIRGRFDGTLTVRRLIIRETAKVSGTVRYGQLRIERGGRIEGEVTVADLPAVPESPDQHVV
ncbi:MAG TPA: polymer-forming cytoskeletal protein [Aliidongia sp.]|nr:polymer-forming cytoskeletal protein [Aliidongia sp.]